jgi:EAL domain-containing protein (putative c-di-GMP-specific phosphodiesterase class I)
VETALQLDCLKQLASDAEFFTQGYLFSKPLPANEFEAKYISARESC